MPVTVESLAAAAAIITCGYFVFGISGFGSALLAVPVLSHFWPVQFVLPITAMLDLVAAVTVGVSRRAEAERSELARMIPLALIGAALGVTLLVNLPHDAALASLGAFVVAYAIYGLSARAPVRPIGRGWGYLAGLVGGASGALFGVAGPAHVMYLSRRVPDKTAFRATLATMVFFSVVIRLALFALAGLISRNEALVAAILLPFLFLGLWIGGRVHVRLAPAQLARIVSLLLIVAGASLLARACAG